MSTNLGRAVRQARRKRNMTQWDLAKKLGYDTGQFISNIERGLCDLPPQKLRDTSKVLRVRPRILIEAAAKDYVKRFYNKIRKGRK